MIPEHPIKTKMGSPEYKAKMSAIAKARNYGKWMFGRKLSATTCHKMSISSSGKIRSSEHCLHLSQSLKGKPKFTLRGRKHITPQMRQKMLAGRKNYKPTLAQLKALSVRWGKGSLSPMWKGGITKNNALIRSSYEMRQWRHRVFERDEYKCIFGGATHGNKLHADHIKPFAYFPELRFDISNGRTLCETCHKQSDTYLSKAKAYADTRT